MKSMLNIVLGAALFAAGAYQAWAGAPASAPATSTAPATRPMIKEAADVATPRHANSGAVDPLWMRRHTQFVDKAKAGNIDLYMLGDSITDFWQSNPTFRPNWERNLGGWKPGDFGISGDRTQHVLWRIQNGELDGVTPKAIVLMIGTNNLPVNPAIANNTPEETAKGVEAIVKTLREKEPQARILLLAVFLRADARATKDVTGGIDKINEIIAKLDDGEHVKFMNINAKFLNQDGKLDPQLMQRDMLHPSDKGYQVWADAIRPVLTEWLGPPAATEAGK